MSARLKPRPAFRAMEAADLDAVTAVENAVYPYPWTRGNFDDSLRAGFDCRVLEWEGVLAGYGVVMVAVDEAHLLNLTVAADWQRQGFGRRILGHFMGRARRAGATSMLLEVRPSNRAARALYAAAGFAEIAERRNYYPAPGGRENAIVMGRAL